MDQGVEHFDDDELDEAGMVASQITMELMEDIKKMNHSWKLSEEIWTLMK